MTNSLCTDCTNRLECVTRKFTDDKEYIGFSRCPRRRHGERSCFDIYADFVGEYKLGCLECKIYEIT